MRKIITTALPIMALALFIAIMLSSSFMKKPFHEREDISALLKITVQDVKEEAWDKAKEDTKALKEAWQKIIKRIQFSSERDEINKISICIARLKGALQTQDKSDALLELFEANTHWENLGA